MLIFASYCKNKLRLRGRRLVVAIYNDAVKMTLSGFTRMARDFQIVPDLLNEKQCSNLFNRVHNKMLVAKGASPRSKAPPGRTQISFVEFLSALERIAVLCFATLTGKDTRQSDPGALTKLF